MGNFLYVLGKTLKITLLGLLALAFIFLPAVFMVEAFGVLWVIGSTIFAVVFFTVWIES